MFEKLAEDIYNATIEKLALFEKLPGIKQSITEAGNITRRFGGMSNPLVKGNPLARMDAKTRLEQYMVSQNKKPGWNNVIQKVIKKDWPVNTGNPYEGTDAASRLLKSNFETLNTGGNPISQDVIDKYFTGKMNLHNYSNPKNAINYIEPGLLDKLKSFFIG